MMNLKQQLAISSRLIWREWKGGELTILLLAVLIAIASHTAIGHFTDRISRAMAINANDIIGGDLVYSSPTPIDNTISAQASKLGLEMAEIQRFFTVVNSGDEILLVSVKSVSDGYPLKGGLKITEELFGPEITVDHGPPSGEVWVESRVLQVLGTKLNDTITIGDADFIITRILTFEPDRGNNFYSFNPRVMISERDLAKTQVVQPGSRVRYRQMYAGDQARIASFKAWLEQVVKPGQSIKTLEDDRPAVNQALEKAKQYMGLTSIIALLLAAIAIANSGRHYSERHYDTSALLRCMGCRQNDILRIYLFQLAILALIGGIIGNLIGWLGQAGLFIAVGNLLPDNVPNANLKPVISGMVLSFIVLIGFTLPSILRLKSVSPQRVLRKDLTPMPLSVRLVYAGTATLIVAMMWFYTGNFYFALSIIGGSALVIAVATILIYGLFKIIVKFLPRIPVNLRAGIRNFLRRRREAVVQTMAFGLTIMAMLVVLFLRTELVTTWQNTIPEDAPNHFVLNIQSSEVKAYQQFTKDNNIRADGTYPIIRGRLTHINNTGVTDVVSKEDRNDESLNRELNFTWSRIVPKDNKIIKGTWWHIKEAQDGKNLDKALVSVESQLADRLGINVGDKLSFFTGDQQWNAIVSNIRTVKWDNFNPNFYLIFNPGSLDNLPTTWINSFYIEPERKKLLVNMIKQFPSITLLEMDAVLNQVKSIITQVMLAVESILFFVLLAGFIVTLSTIQSSMNDRSREGALIRTLGASRKLLRINQWSEFSSLGFIAGIIGVAGAEAINYSLYKRIFELEYTPTLWAWAIVPVIAALLIGLAGIYSSRRIIKDVPLQSLRELHG